MAGGISLNFQYGAGAAEKRKRQQEAAVLAQQLLEKGAAPDAVNAIATNYAKTGNYEVPQYQTKQLPPTNLFPEGIPVREPFQLNQKKKGLYGFDQGKGLYTDTSGRSVDSIPEGIDPEIRNYNSTPPTGEDIFVDSQGNEVRRTPNQGKTNKVHVLPKPAGEGKETPDVTLAKGVIATIKKLQADGMPIPDELLQSGYSAADVLKNVSIEQPAVTVTDEPGFIPKLFGAKPTTRTEKGEPVVKFNSTPKNDAKTAKATAWLQSVKKPVTPANIQAAIKAGKGD